VVNLSNSVGNIDGLESNGRGFKSGLRHNFFPLGLELTLVFGNHPNTQNSPQIDHHKTRLKWGNSPQTIIWRGNSIQEQIIATNATLLNISVGTTDDLKSKDLWFKSRLRPGLPEAFYRRKNQK
jgi:hypothetical protein